MTVQKPLQPEQVGGLNVADVNVADLLAGPGNKMIGRWDLLVRIDAKQMVRDWVVFR